MDHIQTKQLNDFLHTVASYKYKLSEIDKGWLFAQFDVCGMETELSYVIDLTLDGEELITDVKVFNEDHEQEIILQPQLKEWLLTNTKLQAEVWKD